MLKSLITCLLLGLAYLTIPLGAFVLGSLEYTSQISKGAGAAIFCAMVGIFVAAIGFVWTRRST